MALMGHIWKLLDARSLIQYAPGVGGGQAPINARGQIKGPEAGPEPPHIGHHHSGGTGARATAGRPTR